MAPTDGGALPARAEATEAHAPPAESEGGEAQEALRRVAALLREGKAVEAAALIRCSTCGAAPASDLAALRHAVAEALAVKDQLQLSYETLLDALRPSAPATPPPQHAPPPPPAAAAQEEPAALEAAAAEAQPPLREEAEAAAAIGPPPALLPQTVELVLRQLVQAQQHSRAAELLRTLGSTGADLPSDAALNSAIDSSLRARAFGEAWDTLELLLSRSRRADKYFVSILTKSLETTTDRRAIRRGIALVDRFIEQQRDDVDEIVFNSLLNVLGQVGDMQKLQLTLAKMTKYGVVKSAVTYGTIVKAYGKAHDIEAVIRVWTEMRGRCLGVNPVTCGCVLDACVKCGHLDQAMAIFQEIKVQGLHKNTVLYATLIKGLAKEHNLMGAMQLYQEMRMEGVPCNLVTFNSLMDVCVRCGDMQAAALFLLDMMHMGIEPDLITFSTLIKGYSHTGEFQKALALSNELRTRGLKCDEIMYNSLIDGCAKAGRLEEGLQVFDDMLHNRVAPSNITFSILVRLYFEAGQVQEAFRLVSEMSPKYRCSPNRVVYTVLLRCCGQRGGPALAMGAALLAELGSRRNSKLPDLGMVGAIMTGAVQHGELELAIRVVKDCTQSGPRRGAVHAPLEALRALAVALGGRDEAKGQDLLQFLRLHGLPSAHLGELQVAFIEGRRHGGGLLPASGEPGLAALLHHHGHGGGADLAGLDSYCQWPASMYAHAHLHHPLGMSLYAGADPYGMQQGGGGYHPGLFGADAYAPAHGGERPFCFSDASSSGGFGGDAHAISLLQPLRAAAAPAAAPSPLRASSRKENAAPRSGKDGPAKANQQEPRQPPQRVQAPGLLLRGTYREAAARSHAHLGA